MLIYCTGFIQCLTAASLPEGSIGAAPCQYVGQECEEMRRLSVNKANCACVKITKIISVCVCACAHLCVREVETKTKWKQISFKCFARILKRQT